MSIRLPVDASQNVQAAFRDVEQELETLKAAVTALSAGTDLTALNERIDRIPPPPQLDSDKNVFVASGPQASAGLVPAPKQPTADNEALLNENGGWGYPARGLVRAVTTLGAVGGTQHGADVVDIQGHLAVLGGLSTDEILARAANITGDLTVGGTVTGGTIAGVTSKTLSNQTTLVGNVGAGEDDLMTYTLPASTLSTNTGMIRVTVIGRMEGNANVKTVKFKFGATSITLFTNQALATAFEWYASLFVTRTGAATQDIDGWLLSYNAATGSLSGTRPLTVTTRNTAAETLSGTIVVKLTGEATTTDDIRQNQMIVELLQA